MASFGPFLRSSRGVAQSSSGVGPAVGPVCRKRSRHSLDDQQMPEAVSGRVVSTHPPEPVVAPPAWPIWSEERCVLRTLDLSLDMLGGKVERLAQGRFRCLCGQIFRHRQQVLACCLEHGRKAAMDALAAVLPSHAEAGCWLACGQSCPACGSTTGGWVCAGIGHLSEHCVDVKNLIRRPCKDHRRHCVHGCLDVNGVRYTSELKVVITYVATCSRIKHDQLKPVVHL